MFLTSFFSLSSAEKLKYKNIYIALDIGNISANSLDPDQA